MKLIFLTTIILTVASCTRIEVGKTSPSNPYDQELTRKIQRTLRYDCNKDLISDQLETINSVSKSFLVEPPKTLFLKTFVAKNIESGDTAGGIFIDKGHFKIDIAPTVFNIKVYPGLNEIRYQFGYCYDLVGTQSQCRGPMEFTQEQSMWINVTYKEEVIPGFRTLSPSYDRCSHINNV